MEVLILSKTHIGANACVGGIVLENLQPIRLHNDINSYQPGNTEFEIGQIWNIEFNNRPDTAPHVEDVIILSKKIISENNNIKNIILDRCIVWRGGPESLFNGMIKWTGNGSGYINDADIPPNSVGFWINDKDLRFENSYYSYPPLTRFHTGKRLSYVGFTEAIGVIPAGSLIRVSLAKWWKPKDIAMENRCYLQLSGWY